MTVTVTNENQENLVDFNQWCFNQTIEIEHRRKTVEFRENEQAEERKRLNALADKLERQKKELQRQRESLMREENRKNSLFDSKLRILEGELFAVAQEREKLEKEREFFEREKEKYGYGNARNDSNSSSSKATTVKGELFFCGVRDKSGLKRRYRELLKIYHPDNSDGDTETVAIINQEYEKLISRFT